MALRSAVFIKVLNKKARSKVAFERPEQRSCTLIKNNVSSRLLFPTVCFSSAPCSCGKYCSSECTKLEHVCILLSCVQNPQPGQSITRNIKATGSKTELPDQRTCLTPKAAEPHPNRDHCGNASGAPGGAHPPSIMEIPTSSTASEVA